jgi:hypothetical protein
LAFSTSRVISSFQWKWPCEVIGVLRSDLGLANERMANWRIADSADG